MPKSSNTCGTAIEKSSIYNNFWKFHFLIFKSKKRKIRSNYCILTIKYHLKTKSKTFFLEKNFFFSIETTKKLFHWYCCYFKLYENVFQTKHTWLYMNLISVEFILELFNENKIHEDKSNILMQRFPGSKGFLVASIKREQLHVTPRI